MVTYLKADKATHDFVTKVRNTHHGADLKKMKVTFDVLLAHGPTDEEDNVLSPAVKMNGYPSMANLKVHSRKERTKGLADVELVLDGDEWEELDAETAEAIIDQQLTRLELVVDADGEPKKDDLGRPRLTLRKFDHAFFWFTEVLQRHGNASMEAQDFMQFATAEGGQMFFDFLPKKGSKPKAVNG